MYGDSILKESSHARPMPSLSLSNSKAPPHLEQAVDVVCDYPVAVPHQRLPVPRVQSLPHICKRGQGRGEGGWLLFVGVGVVWVSAHASRMNQT